MVLFVERGDVFVDVGVVDVWGGGELDDRGGGVISCSVETSTLKWVVTRSAVPVKGSVPAWMAWMYCVFATPCLLTRYSVNARRVNGGA